MDRTKVFRNCDKDLNGLNVYDLSMIIDEWRWKNDCVKMFEGLTPYKVSVLCEAFVAYVQNRDLKVVYLAGTDSSYKSSIGLLFHEFEGKGLIAMVRLPIQLTPSKRLGYIYRFTSKGKRLVHRYLKYRNKYMGNSRDYGVFSYGGM